MLDQLYGLFSFFKNKERVTLPKGGPVIIMGEDAAVIYSRGGTGPMASIERRALLPWRMPGFEAAMQEALSGLKGQPAPLLLFNGSNQKYFVEETPASLRWYDAPRFVKRKAEMALPESVTRGWMRQPANPDVKAPPVYLMVGIDKTAPMLRMAAAMNAAGIKPSGCGTLPLESLSLATELAAKLPRKGPPSRWVMLMAQHENGCLRQIISRDGGMIITRITPTPYLPGEEKWDEEAGREFNATLIYMARRGFTPEQGLDFIVLCDKADKAFFEKKPDAARNVNAVTVAEAMKAIMPGIIASPPPGNFADALHAAWASNFAALRVPLPYPQLTPVVKDGKTLH
ncbi:MAG: hypothetical protein ACAH80_13705 [Alphaproteobacteria bacterium]